MSRIRAELRRRAAGDDRGLGLIEIIIALTIFAVAILATAPLFLGGLTAGKYAKQSLQAKSLGNERLERMRNLPYHVARQNGQYLDVLDIYFRDTTASGALATGDTCSTRTYNSATYTYTCRITNLGATYTAFTQTVDSTFVNASRTAVAPFAGYNSQTAGVDQPVSNLLQVVVTTTWTQGTKTRSFRLRSFIANAQASANQLAATVRASAVDINSNLSSGDVLQFEGGLVSAEGALNTGSTASLSVAAARGGISSGTQIAGAALSIVAPPNVTGGSPTGNAQFLDGSTCARLCFGNSSINGNQALTLDTGQPKVSLSSDQVYGSLKRSGTGPVRGFSYGNATASEVDPALMLDTSSPMISGGTGSAGSEVLRGGGYLDATGTGTTSVVSSATVSLQALYLFPSTLAPTAPGLVKLDLTSATLTCQSGGGTASLATPTYAGHVSYWSTAVGDYVSYDVGPGKPALPAPSTLMVAPGYPLSLWIDSWSALNSTTTPNETANKQAKGNIKPVISVVTKPTRAGDSTSPLNIAVGTLACVAEDYR